MALLISSSLLIITNETFIETVKANGGGIPPNSNVLWLNTTCPDITIGDTFYTLVNATIHRETDNISVSNITFDNYLDQAGFINYTGVTWGDLFSDPVNSWTPHAVNTSNSTGYAYNLTRINSSCINNTAGTFANITWYANNVGVTWINLTATTKNNSNGEVDTVVFNTTITIHPEGPSSLSAMTHNDTQINLTFTGANNLGVDKIVIRRQEGTNAPSLNDGTEIYNDSGTEYADNNNGNWLSTNTTYSYTAWGWNETAGLYSQNVVSNQSLTYPILNTTVKGYIDNSYGVNISGALVQAINSTKAMGVLDSNTTDETGYYELTIFGGHFNITYYKDMYEPAWNDSVYGANRTIWNNMTLTSGGPLDVRISNYQSSVSPGYIINDTGDQKFNFTLLTEMDNPSWFDSINITIPAGFTYVENNGTSLNPSEVTVSNTSNKIFWNATGLTGFQFNVTEYFWFNVSANAPLGAASFNITAVHHNTSQPQDLTFTVFNAETFYYTGSIYNSTGQAIEGAVAEIIVSGMGGPDSPPVTLDNFNATSDANGEFNITDIPICENYSQISCEGPMGPGSGGTLFYQLAAYEYNDSSNNYAINTSRTLPSLPATELICMLGNPEFYLIPAVSFNVTAVGPDYDYDGFPPELTGYSSKSFEVMVKDQALGYPVKEYTTQASQRIFSVPASRNYTLSLYPEMSFPMSIRFNDISSTCNAANPGDYDIFGIPGVNTSFVEYNGTYLINVVINTTSSAKNLTGNFTGITSPDSMRIVTYNMETQNMVFEGWAMPFNLGYDEGWSQYNDTYNLSACNFSITLPATEAPSYLMLRAYAHNASGYYMGTNIINASNGNLNVSSLNFTMQKLINGTNRSITANNVSNFWNSETIVNTTSVLFKLVNSTGEPLSDENAFVEVKRELDGIEYLTMMNAENGEFNLSLVEGASIKKLTIFSQQYAPLSAPVDSSILSGSVTNRFFNFTGGVCNVTMRSFGDFDPLNQSLNIRMQMFLSNSSNNIPNPPRMHGLLGEGQGEKEQFSPLNAILKGDINMMISTNKVSVYYINVDLLASGPPDASFTDEGEQSEGFSSLWKFGSQGPDIYDYVLIGVNYSGMHFENYSDITMEIPYLYNQEFTEVLWNRSAGDTISDISSDDNLSDYVDFLEAPYDDYFDGTGVLCDPNNPNLENGLGYRDEQNTTIWMKIPHFSSLGLGGSGTIIVDKNGGGDYTTIQGAINASSDGDTIRIWDGTYTENVVVNKSVTIEANSSAVLDGSDSGHGMWINVSNVTIQNLSVTNCTSSEDGIFYSGIYVYNSSCTLENVTLDNVTVNDSDVGVYTNNIAHSDITNCNLSNNGVLGIYLINTNYCNISYNEINGTTTASGGPVGGSAVYFENSGYNNVFENIVCNNTMTGFYVSGATGNNIYNNTFWNDGVQLTGTSLTHHIHTIENNTVNGDELRYYKDTSGMVLDENNDTGQIILANCSNFEIRNMTLETPLNTAIHLAYSTDVNVSNCNISNNSIAGVYLTYSDSNEFYSNNISNISAIGFGNDANGIYLSHSNSNNVSSNNIYNISIGSGITAQGIYLTYSNSSNISSNTIYNNTDGISLSNSDNNNISSNDLFNNTNYGISFSDSNNNEIFSNNIFNNSNWGINLDSSQYNNINLNDVYTNSEDGINLGTSDNNNITSNDIYNNTEFGIRLWSSSNNNISSNTILNNSDNGIVLLSSSTNTIFNNNISNNADGVYLYDSSNNNNLTSNICLENTIGIYLNRGCNYNNITSNNCTGNTESGIYLVNDGNNQIGCENNTIANNTCNGLDTSTYGIRLRGNNNYNNNITENTCNNNTQYGIYTSSYCSEINNNTCNDNHYGIELFSTYNNNVTNNTCNENFIGIRIQREHGDNNNLTKNTCTLNTYGIRIYGLSSNICDNNTITSNNCSSNTYGIHLNEYTEDNIIYNNKLVGNSNENAYDNGTNAWNTTKTSETNIVEGIFLGGNYWSDYNGSDTTHDGMGETNYSIPGPGNNNDTYPLVISPEVSSFSPIDDSTDVSRTIDIRITFSKSMNQTTTEGNITFTPSSSYTWSNNNKTLTIDPSSSLSYSAEYAVTVGWNATDEDGNVMLENYTCTFNTESDSSDDPSGDGPTYINTNNAPVADAGGPYTGTVNEDITFDGSDSSDEDGDDLTYTWEFGDGETATGETVTHSYTSAGIFDVNLTVSDSSEEDTDSTTATIESSTSQTAPSADAGGPYSALTFEDITFDGSDSTDPDGNIENYTWDFGDGNTSYGVKPVHSYETSGLFNITLTVTDDDGLTDTDTTTANITLDTDADGWSDEMEESYGTDINDATSKPIDTDGDGVPDDDSPDGKYTGDPDDDGDGLSDAEETNLGLDPKDPSDVKGIAIDGESYYLLDSNKDGSYEDIYNKDNDKVTIEKDGEDYLIDTDGDGTWDKRYNPSEGSIVEITEDEEGGGIFSPLLIVGIIVIIIVLLIAVMFKTGYLYVEDKETKKSKKKGKHSKSKNEKSNSSKKNK